MRPIRDILNDLLVHIGYLEQFSSEGRDRFLQDIKTQFAVRLAFELVGDLAGQIPDSLLETQPQIEWRGLKGMRVILAHRYHQLDLDTVWNSTADLPRLRAAVEALLATLPPEPDEN
jgi:uncharacterized protein with HEPN domain